ncbi:SLAC1 anion channel family protein [Rhodovulum sulfidophilum]|uniref:SLAC1 anion channel family protein n=1 Tax=Rhodovulum sulfidophilum TaxID=35806 RepID=UPI00192409B7|nr:SLAC1 anion channel family protein [Rhodovulum sulfidophilum]MBL3574732.1 SLAC1 anion channel family protein [Rhodovulum sulfidophilum]MCE8431835.1 SLAC1 anion channel family protein [Rhodovulum sulfidophilum]MCF4115458.1 SLAC1 anion channel family protein [Rhodovulum sulfidophilum]
MSTTAETDPGPRDSRLAHFPVTFFATVMGMMGLTLAWHAGEQALGPRLGLSLAVSPVLLYASCALLVAVAALYALKLATHFPMAAAEWQHPVRLAFFPTASISLILLSVALMGDYPALARPVWIAGTALQGLLSLMVISDWIGQRHFQPIHLNAAWFIPPVGNILVPVAGVPLGHPEISWLFFSGGALFWVVLLTLVMNRLTFHDPLPGRLQPTLVILIAPPAVGFISWMRLHGGLDPLAMFFLNAAYVFALIVATQLPRILRLPFALSFWALSFPLAALTIATFLYADASGSAFHLWLGGALLAFLSAVIAGLVGRTLLAIARNEICHPE